MKHGTCIHFNGTLNDACKRGVNYEVNWPKSPKPCIQFIEKSVRGGTVLKPGEEPAERKPFPGADTAKPCPFWEAPTDEQVQADREALDRGMQATLAAMKLAGAWRVFGNLQGQRYTKGGWKATLAKLMTECRAEAARRRIPFESFSLQDCRPKGVSDKMARGDTDVQDAALHSSGRMIAQVYDRRRVRVAKPAG